MGSGVRGWAPAGSLLALAAAPRLRLPEDGGSRSGGALDAVPASFFGALTDLGGEAALAPGESDTMLMLRACCTPWLDRALSAHALHAPLLSGGGCSACTIPASCMGMTAGIAAAPGVNASAGKLTILTRLGLVGAAAAVGVLPPLLGAVLVLLGRGSLAGLALGIRSVRRVPLWVEICWLACLAALRGVRP